MTAVMRSTSSNSTHHVRRLSPANRAAARAIIALVACAAFPLVAILVFGLVQAGVYEIATRDVPGAGVVRAMPAFWGSEFVSQPTEEPARAGRRFYIYSGSMGSHVLRDLWSLITLDPNMVGATRREALWMVGSGYAAAVLVCAASTVIGLWLGQWLCGLPAIVLVGRRGQAGEARNGPAPAPARDSWGVSGDGRARRDQRAVCGHTRHRNSPCNAEFDLGVRAVECARRLWRGMRDARVRESCAIADR